MQIKTKIVSCHAQDSKPVKQEVNGTVILPPLVLPATSFGQMSVGQMSVGQMSVGQMSIGQMSWLKVYYSHLFT